MSSNLVASPLAVSRYTPATTTYSCPLASAYSFPDSSFSTYAIGTTSCGAASVLPPVPSQQVNSTTAQTNSKTKGNKENFGSLPKIFDNPLFAAAGFLSFIVGALAGLFHGKSAAHA